MEGEVTNRDNDVVAIELPAPKGWKKRVKFILSVSLLCS